MTPSEHKFLFVLTRDAIRRGSGEQIEATLLSNKHVPALRSLGYLRGHDLEERAFQEFFSTFDPIECPTEVKRLVELFGIEMFWRRPRGIIREKMDSAGRGISYPCLKTAFVDDGARLETWFHELGHILYYCIKNNPAIVGLLQALQEEARGSYPTKSHEQMTDVNHPVTKEAVTPSPGKYVLINERYHGLDHSGDGAEGEADELWALLFEEYQSGRDLKEGVRAVMDRITAAIEALAKPPGALR